MAGSLERSDAISTASTNDRYHCSRLSSRADCEKQSLNESSVNAVINDESPQDPNLVDWEGPDDPENPMNWSTAKKVVAIGIVSLITVLSPLTSTIISPVTPDVMNTFHSSNETLGAFVTSVYLLGYSFGPLAIAPLSETYGRAIVYNTCNFIFLIFSIACAVADSLSALIVFRFLSGVAASCPITLGAGTIADMIPLERRGLAMVALIMGPLVGPTFGPLVYGYMYLLFTTFPRVFQGQYGFSNSSVGLTYLGVGIGCASGLIFCGAISDRLVKTLTTHYGGDPKPEYRLPAMFIGALCVPIGLFLYGWSADKKVHWIVPIIGTAFLGVGMFVIFMPAQTYLVDAYTIYAASASAAATVFRSVLGSTIPLAGNSMYDALGLGWGTSLLGFIAVAFIPVPFVFWKFGERIRNSKYTRAEF
ncbi:MAG: hypothetical protein Q9227_005506 [Pyrenula ochraceoflavens]